MEMKPSVVLNCFSGPDQGKRLALADLDVLIGRSAQCNLASDDPDVAERHVIFSLRDGRPSFQTIGDATVFVDGTALKEGVLQAGQQARIGRSLWQIAGASNAQSFTALLDNIGSQISSAAGMEKIEGFNAREMFSAIFQKRSDEEIEQYFSVGGPLNTPPLAGVDTNWPKPWLFFKAFIAAAIVYSLFDLGWHLFNNRNLIPGMITVGSFVMPFSILIFFFEVNAPRNVSLYQVIKLVLLGGVLSLVASLFLFQLTNLSSVMGPPAAGIIEEVGKALVLLLVVNKLKYRWTLNGMLFGAAIGTGFAAFESSGYAFRYLWDTNSAQVMTQVIYARGWLSILGGHVLWAGMVGAALWRVRGDEEFRWDMVKDIRFWRVLAIAAGVHAVWNANFRLPLYLKEVALGFVAWVVILSLIQDGLKQIRAAQSQLKRDM
jgi:RsiW-degrading membrane proteinase PrsW (M82 family)